MLVRLNYPPPDLLVEAFLRGPNIANALQKLIEIVLAEGSLSFEPLVIQHKALDDVLLEPFCGPAAELNAPVAAHPVADCQYHIQVVEVHQPLYQADALGLN